MVKTVNSAGSAADVSRYMIVLGFILVSSFDRILALASPASEITKEFQDTRETRYGRSYDSRWNNQDDASISENDIISTSDQKPYRKPYKSQQGYVCGRAIANKKYKDSLLGDQNYKSATTRTKYRPIEIRMPRIIGGDETSPGEFPWAASIKLNGQPICGGSLIESSWILTAAHCVVGYNPKNLTVRLGAYRIKDTSEPQTIESSVGMFIVHKEYSMPRPFSNDIALLKLIEPIEYTDFIIPICLPTEDQITTSTSSVVVNDYSNRFHFDRQQSPGEDSSGIVVSTKMSDHEIAKCFTRIEQNYLNSIGLGTTEAEYTTEQYSTTRSKPSPAVDQQLFSSPTLLDSLFSMHQMDNLEKNVRRQHKQHSNKLTFAQQGQAEQSFAPTSSIGNNAVNILGQSHQNDHVYYGLHWNRKDSNEHDDRSEASNRAARGFRPDSSRREAVKLSRLPISKELLREIQSVGSGALSELNLGLQQSDIIAMASDLAHSSISGGGGGGNNNHNTQDDRMSHNERQQDNHRRPSSSQQDNSSLRRSPAIESESSLDEPARYSGLSGTVVGWGWVREQDVDEQVSNKGYPSVTLQKVRLPILRNSDCEAWFQSQTKKITLLPSQFCAGFNSGGKDACRGDSGGPMIIEDSSDSGRFKLIGIVSAGIGCARPSLPGLYTRVASFLPWINLQTSRHSAGFD